MNEFGFNNFEQYTQQVPWNKYDAVIKELSNEQKIFVGKQKSVITAKQNLMTAFIDYLFEVNKNNFVMASPVAKDLADEYINAISKAAGSYVSHNEELEKENAELKKQLQQFLNMEGKKDGKNKAAAE